MTFPALANDGSVVNLLTGAELSGLLQTIGNNAIAPATQPISGTVSVAGTVPVSGSFYPSTQPVSIAAPVSVTGTVAVTGVATSALQTTGNGYLQSIVTAVQDTTPAAVTQSGTWSVNLGTLNGAATEVTLAALNTKQPTVGQKVKSGSVPVTLASDHDPIDTVFKSTATSRSGTFGTTAGALMPANTARRGIYVQNQHATAKIYINGQTTAVAGDGSSLMIGPGQLYESSVNHTGTGAISVISDTASTPVYAREW